MRAGAGEHQLAIQGAEPIAFERIVGIPLRSYRAVAVSYFFDRLDQPTL